LAAYLLLRGERAQHKRDRNVYHVAHFIQDLINKKRFKSVCRVQATELPDVASDSVGLPDPSAVDIQDGNLSKGKLPS
jgi:hypothetical protein